MSAKLLSRIARPALHSKIVPAEETIKHFKPGQSIGWSGFSPTNYPKVRSECFEREG